ncbi:TetR family transcriptional regulator [Pseudonocardia sp. P1]
MRVPRVVDHGQRRGEIAEALWRVAADEGLEAVSLARVAQEAGVSKGRVQHYFTSRDELLGYAAQQLQLRIDERIRAQLAAARPATPLDEVRALLVALLPLDDDAATDARVGSAFLIRALGDAAMRETYRSGNRLIREAVAGRLDAAHAQGEIGAVDAEQEATVLIALVGGLAEGILLGEYASASAVGTVEHQVGRLRRP